MHRVYNSAFMHMLRDEDNAKYRKVIKNTLEFDPEILKRYVNFMNNPDEKTARRAVRQGRQVLRRRDGDGDDARACRCSATARSRASARSTAWSSAARRWTSSPDAWLVERHEREIFPLLHRRGVVRRGAATSCSTTSSRRRRASTRTSSPTRTAPGPSAVAGRLPQPLRLDERAGSASRRRTRSRLQTARSAGPPHARRGLGPARRPVGVRGVPRRSHRAGVPALGARSSGERGLQVSLDAYGGHVFWEFRELHDGVRGQWARLAARLGDRAVPSLDEALRELQLEPVHAPLRAIFARRPGGGGPRRPARTGPARRAGEAVRVVPDAVAEATGVAGDPAAVAGGRPATGRRRLPRRPTAAASRRRPGRAARLAGPVADRGAGTGADVAATSRAWYDELRLPGALAAGLREAGLDEGEAWTVADQVRVLLALPRPSELRGPARTADARLLDRWLADDAVRRRSGSTPGKASSGSTATGSRRSSPGRAGSMRSTPDRVARPPMRRMPRAGSRPRRSRRATGSTSSWRPSDGRVPVPPSRRVPRRWHRARRRGRNPPNERWRYRPSTSYTWRGASRARLPDRAPTRPGDAAVKGSQILGTNRSTIRPAGDVRRGCGRRRP